MASRRASDPDGLTPRERLFVEAYVHNGGNTTRAYLVAAPHVKETTAGVEGWKLLKTPKVAAVLEKRRQQRFKELQMTGDEALALIAMRARADVAQAYNANGQLLPINQWPEALRLACRTRGDKDGNVEWQFPDGLKAAELMAVAAGKLKTTLHVNVFDHVAHLLDLDTPPEKEKT
jgi:phage terminase small subunit